MRSFFVSKLRKVMGMKKAEDAKTLKKEALFWRGIKEALAKDGTKRCHK